MAPKNKPPTSAKVNEVIKTLKKNPELVQQMHEFFAGVYEEAEVTALSPGEKAELFFHIGSMIKSSSVI